MSTPSVAHELPASITRLLDEYQIPAAAVSLDVRDLTSGEFPLSVRAEIARNPASVIKLLLTLVALETLGPGYQWQTTYLADGPIENGVLNGDLVLQGGGDPFLTADRLLIDLLALRQTGLVSIAGDLVIDNSLFAAEPHDRASFDGKAHRAYNVGPDAALINFSATHFVIMPIDGHIQVTAEPPLAGLEIINQLTAQPGACISPYTGWSHRIIHTDTAVQARFRGHYRPDCGKFIITRNLFDNSEYTYRLLTALWRALGGELINGYRIARATERARLLLVRESVPLADIITGINKFSNNVMSRQLLLTLGAEYHTASDPNGGRPLGTTAAGIAAIRAWLVANNIDIPELVIENGAGLSRKTRISTRSLSALLAHGWASTYRPELLSSLPLAAIDGTMRKRLLGSPLAGRARIKTGLINNVRSMAGYVHAKNGRHYSVAMIVTSHRVNFERGNALQDAVLRWVYERM